MHFYRLTALGIVTTLSVLPSKADWQFTRWGMSPTAVIEASKGEAKLETNEGKSISPGVAKVVAPYKAGPYEFRAFFNFNNDALDAVSLQLQDNSACGKLGQSLREQYGQPFEDEQIFSLHVTKWRDTKNSNVVQFSDSTRGGCSVKYFPLETKGL